MSFIVNRTITFIDSNKFYKGTLDTLVSNLDDNDFKYSMSEFSPDKIRNIENKRCIPL